MCGLSFDKKRTKSLAQVATLTSSYHLAENSTGSQLIIIIIIIINLFALITRIIM